MIGRGADERDELGVRHDLVLRPRLEEEVACVFLIQYTGTGPPRPATMPIAMSLGSSPARIAAVCAPSE
jgi:hypothetical protein